MGLHNLSASPIFGDCPELVEIDNSERFLLVVVITRFSEGIDDLGFQTHQHGLPMVMQGAKAATQ